MSGHYILVGHQVVSCSDLLTWARWFESADRHVKLTEQGDVSVSTVFLGLDHGFRDEGPPIVFETMVFVGHSSEDCERYSTWEEAEEGHARWVAQVFKPTPIVKLPEKA
jgi:hypothetical protein